MIGNKYTKLTVESQITKAKWLCKCDCGNTVEVYTCQLEEGNNKSCGCLKREATISRNTTHGMSDRPEYGNWKDMKKRCFNKNNKRYEDYAGRGISVHADFVDNFPAWLAEIGPKPIDGQRWSVGRIDNDGWYTYGNMEWQLDDTQARNHSMQSNNTSGIVGVKYRERVIAGRMYRTFTATWTKLDGKKATKDFSADKYGYDLAKEMATAHRNKAIAQLNREGAGYASSHGSGKV